MQNKDPWREATDAERADFARRYSQPDTRPEEEGQGFFWVVVICILVLVFSLCLDSA